MMTVRVRQQGALLAEKKSVGEKDHPSELRDGRRPCERLNEFELW